MNIVLEVVLAILALGAFTLCVWLLRDRTRLAAAAAEGNARLDTIQRLESDLDLRRKNAAETDARLSDALAESARLHERIAAYERRQTEESQRLAELHQQFQNTFDALAGKALDASTKRFLELAKQSFQAHHEQASADYAKRAESVQHLVKPIQEALAKTHERIAEIEKARTESFVALREQIRSAADVSRELRERTEALANALRKPHVRGAYGEVQLRRVAELAGMRDYCDFNEQSSQRDSQGRLLRPDLVVQLPNDRCIAIDAKTNIEAYLEALETEDAPQREAALDRFARHVYEQAAALARKQYWSAYDGSPEFVIMFVPGDQFVDAALQRRPDLLDFAAEHGVIIASPSTLIGLLRAVHVGWREKSLSDAAEELFKLGNELHERAAIALGHASDVGRAIEQAMDRYNKFVGSVDQRLMPTLRKFEEAGARSAKQLEDLQTAETARRELQSLPETPPPPLPTQTKSIEEPKIPRPRPEPDDESTRNDDSIFRAR